METYVLINSNEFGNVAGARTSVPSTYNTYRTYIYTRNVHITYAPSQFLILSPSYSYHFIIIFVQRHE